MTIAEKQPPVPERHKWIVNYSEFNDFATHVLTQRLDQVLRVVEMMMATRETVQGFVLDELAFEQAREQRQAENALLQERARSTTQWMTEVAKPQLEKFLDFTCLPVAGVEPPLIWKEQWEPGATWVYDPEHMLTHDLVGTELWLDSRVLQGNALGRWFADRYAESMAYRGFQVRYKMPVRNRDITRFWNEFRALPPSQYHEERRYQIAEQLPETAWYFCRDWATECIDSIRDWMSSGECRMPRQLNKLGLKQAFNESVKWHHVIEARKKKEAEEKLRNMTVGDRKTIGTIQMRVRKGDDELDLQSITIERLFDKEALEYEAIKQHHCVDSYWYRMAYGQCVILHIQQGDNGWTVEISGDMTQTPSDRMRFMNQIRQMKGVCNAQPPSHIYWAMLFWVQSMQMYLHQSRDDGMEIPVLYRHPFYTQDIFSKSPMTGNIGKLVQENSSRRFSGKPYVDSVECFVDQRLPFSGSSSECETKYSFVPKERGSELTVEASTQTSKEM